MGTLKLVLTIVQVLAALFLTFVVLGRQAGPLDQVGGHRLHAPDPGALPAARRGRGLSRSRTKLDQKGRAPNRGASLFSLQVGKLVVY